MKNQTLFYIKPKLFSNKYYVMQVNPDGKKSYLTRMFAKSISWAVFSFQAQLYTYDNANKTVNELYKRYNGGINGVQLGSFTWLLENGTAEQIKEFLQNDDKKYTINEVVNMITPVVDIFDDSLQSRRFRFFVRKSRHSNYGKVFYHHEQTGDIIRIDPTKYVVPDGYIRGRSHKQRGVVLSLCNDVVKSLRKAIVKVENHKKFKTFNDGDVFKPVQTRDAVYQGKSNKGRPFKYSDEFILDNYDRKLTVGENIKNIFGYERRGGHLINRIKTLLTENDIEFTVGMAGGAGNAYATRRFTDDELFNSFDPNLSIDSCVRKLYNAGNSSANKRLMKMLDDKGIKYLLKLPRKGIPCKKAGVNTKALQSQ